MHLSRRARTAAGLVIAVAAASACTESTNESTNEPSSSTGEAPTSAAGAPASTAGTTVAAPQANPSGEADLVPATEGPDR